MSKLVRRVSSAVVLVALAALGVHAIPGAAAATTPDQYVALGDSYSSGVGTASSALDAGCKRSPYAFPALLAKQRPNTTLVFVACSGATTTDVTVSQLSSLPSTATIVTITAGGNDLGFGDLIAQCVQSDCNATLSSTRASAAGTLTPRLDALYRAIRTRAPAARVVVLGYPRLFSTASCFGTTGITSAERTNANLLSDELDRVIGARAAAAGFSYKSAITPFVGHAVCSGSAWLNGLSIFNLTESFHPNRSGHASGYLPALRQVVG